MSRRAAVLHVEVAEGGLRYWLDAASETPAATERHFREVDAATVAALRRSADELLHGLEHGAFRREAETCGRLLYRTLVPERLRAALLRIDGPLIVASALADVPWELLHDGEAFWGERYALARRALVDRPVADAARPRRDGRPRILVVGADPRGDLPFVAHEVEQLCVALAGVGDVVCLAGALATFDAVTAALRDGFDLVHFTGHVAPTPGGGSALLLAQEVPLAPDAIQACLAHAPVVFLNGCRSARGHVPAERNGWGEAIATVAQGFMSGGATAVIATQSDVGDRHAAALAERFYRHALDGMPIGEALRLARVACRDDPRTVASPSWLSFTLFGDPTLSALGAGVAVRDPWRRVRRPTSRRAVFVVALLAFAVLSNVRGWLGRPPAPVVLGVMGVEVRAGEVPTWMREFTRDGLLTVLTEIDGIEVYSKQKIDFLCAKRGLCGIEAAERLGMAAMLTPALALHAETLLLEVTAIDLRRDGMLAAREVAQGPSGGLIALQNDVAFRVLAALGIAPSEAEWGRIVASRTDAELHAYRMLTETLGGAPSPPTPSSTVPPPSGFHRFGGAVAWAADPADVAIRAVLEQYRRALEARSVDAVVAAHETATAERRAALERYFANATDLRVGFSRIDVEVVDDDAIATVTRHDEFRDAATGKPVTLKVRVTIVLRRLADGWRIAGGD